MSTERATRLLVDTLHEVHDSLYDYFVDHAEELNLSRTGPLLDRFGEAITQVRVVGEVQTRQDVGSSMSSSDSSRSEVSASFDSLSVGGASESTLEASRSQSASVERRGREQHTVHFGSTRNVWGEETMKIMRWPKQNLRSSLVIRV